MSQSDAIVAACTALVPLLGAATGAIRYLMRILTQVERVTSIAEAAANQLAAHMTTSDAMHGQLITQVAEHSTRLAVLESKTTTTPGGPA